MKKRKNELTEEFNKNSGKNSSRNFNGARGQYCKQFSLAQRPCKPRSDPHIFSYKFSYDIGGRCREHAQISTYLLLDPAATGLNPRVPTIFTEEKIVHAAKVNQVRFFEESEQGLEYVD